VEPGTPHRVGPWALTAAEVPHADTPRFRTYAWRLAGEGRSFVYASDVARLTDGLEQLAREVDLLVLDGAMYRRSIFSHLRIEQAVPQVCRWRVARILLTQLGRTVPPHEQLEEIVHELCERAAPAYDGLQVRL
jgi:ribonuclease BN (tRNA processing enzyme)